MGQKAVVVTGTSTGIGRAVAAHLSSRGFRVLATARHPSETGTLDGIELDVTDEASIRDAAAAVETAVGEQGLHGLVNNAGTAVSGPLEFLELAEIRRQFEVNLFGQIAVTQSLLPLLRPAKGRIVNISSISGRIAAPLLGPYAMSKFAFEAFSDALRRELEPWEIEVAVIEPGAIQTPIWDKSIESSRARVEAMPSIVRELYGRRIEQMTERARRMSEVAVPAERVAEAVHDALTARRPKTRYLVGTDARVAARLAWLLPDRLLDRLLRRRIR
jgi:NAD(P)-dependent dehydrogenase (short-subunit alcohol dehydrogenase family)